MRLLFYLYIAYATAQAVTAADVTVFCGWLVFALFGLLALSLRWTALLALEGLLWLQVLAIPFLFFQFGSVREVLLNGFAGAFFASGIWLFQGRSLQVLLVPLALIAFSLAGIKHGLMPRTFPQELMDSQITGQVTVEAAPLPAGWASYESPAFSIGVPLGMTSGFMGTGRGNVFTYQNGRPGSETLSSLAMIFPRPTAFEYDPDVATMARQFTGARTELEYARHILNARDGYLFLLEKLSWLGATAPERVEEIHVAGASGFLIAEPRTNWYRVKLYFEHVGFETQTEFWFYGSRTALQRQRVLDHLATLRVHPEHREIPTLAALEKISRGGNHQLANIHLSTHLTLNPMGHEALYLLGLNQHYLGRLDKAAAALSRIDWLMEHGQLEPRHTLAWIDRYAALDPASGWHPRGGWLASHRQ